MASGTLGAALRQIHGLFQHGTHAALHDAQLLERFLAGGEADAFEALVARHGPMVMAVCRATLVDPEDLEDTFQATFVILVKKARAIREGDALAGWLHRVACRVAARANADAARRRALRRRIAASAGSPSVASADDGGIHAALHEELDRLPEKYRLPVVLCELEGLSQPQVATLLRCGEATVRRRLADARDLLKSRLTRRGITPAVATPLVERPWPAMPNVPEAWIRAAVETASRGGVVASGASNAVARLVAGALRPGAATRLGIGLASSLALVSTIALAGGTPPREDADKPPRLAPPPPAQAPKPTPEPSGERAVRGRVLGPSGAPISGAKVFLWKLDRLREPATDPAPSAQSGPDGRFELVMGREPDAPHAPADTFYQLVATAEGFGPAWFSILGGRVPEDLTLRLAEDLPVEGRILDLEGRPVAKARVGLLWLAAPKESLEGLLDMARKEPEFRHTLPGNNSSWIGRLPGHPSFVACDDQGRFKLTGLGRDRIATLILQGGTIADDTLVVATRAMTPVVGPISRRPQPEPPPPLTIYGASFEHAAAPSRPIVGVVRDRDSGAPVAGIRVISKRMPGKALSEDEAPGVITDASGRFELLGHPKAKNYAVAAVPEPGEPYLVGHAQVDDTPGVGPVRAEIELVRGIPYHLRVLEKGTGRPAEASISYFPLSPNPNVRDAIGFGAAGMGPLSRAKAGPDGLCSGVALPGPGAICVEASGNRYVSAKVNPRAFFKPGEPQAKRFDYSYGNEQTLTIEQGRGGIWVRPQEGFHAIVLVNPAKDSAPIELEATLVPAAMVRGEVLAPDGHPLAGVEVWQADGFGTWTPPLPDAHFTLTQVEQARPRMVLFRHVGRKLAGAMVVPSKGSGPTTVSLKPWATLSGRLVDTGGQPRVRTRLISYSPPRNGVDPTVGVFPEWVHTDGNGRFSVEGLVPDLRYRLDAMADGGIPEGSNVFKDLVIRPGEVKDLGDVQVESDRPKRSR